MMNGVKRMMKDDDALGIMEIATEMIFGETFNMLGAYCGTCVEATAGTLCGVAPACRVGFASIWKIIRLMIG